jgi:hypothetical protein
VPSRVIHALTAWIKGWPGTPVKSRSRMTSRRAFPLIEDLDVCRRAGNAQLMHGDGDCRTAFSVATMRLATRRSFYSPIR